MAENLFQTWLVERTIAHRGLHTKEFPENTLGAFQNAINQNVPIELDVQELKDGTVVVFHDKNLQRLTGKDGYLCNLTKEDLHNHKILGTAYHIPSLEEVLTLVDGQVPLLIEIKNDGKVGSLEKNFWHIIKNYSGEYAIQSFNPFTLEWFKVNAPSVIRGQISSFFRNEKMSFVKKSLLKKLVFNKKISYPHFISYCAGDLPNRYVNKYKNLPLLAWCVHSQEEYMKVLPHCDNIIFEGFEPRV